MLWKVPYLQFFRLRSNRSLGSECLIFEFFYFIKVRTYEKTSSTTGCGCTFSIEAIEFGREETEGAGE